MKVTANEIKQKNKEAVETTIKINKTLETYRPVAIRAALMYFVLDQLWVIDHMYQYSLSGFMRVYIKAIQKAAASEDVVQRVKNVIDSVTYTLFSYASRGLFA